MDGLKLNVVYSQWKAHFVNDDGEPSELVLMAESESAARIAGEQWAVMTDTILVSVEPV